MALQLPQSRGLNAPPRTTKNYDNSEMIMKIQGENPLANAIDQLTPILAQALQKRNEMRKQAEQVGTVEKAYGMTPDSLKGLTLDAASKIGKDIYDTKAKVSIAGKKSDSGGYFIPRGTDVESGRPVYSDSKRLGLFYDDNTPYKGRALGGLNLKPLPSDQIQKETDLATLGFALEKVKGSYAEDLVGPIGSRVGRGKQYLEGLATPEAADFYSNLADLQNQILYLRSGKQINEEEFRRLMKALPNAETAPTDFSRRMVNFEQMYNLIVNTRRNALAGSGYRTPPPIPKPIGETNPPNASPGGSGIQPIETAANRKARLIRELSGAK